MCATARKPRKRSFLNTSGKNEMWVFFFETDKWENLFPRLAGLAEYYRRRGCPSEWVFDTVNPNDFGCVQVANGKYGHKSGCPYFECYYLHGHMSSVECKRITELIPGGVQHLYCESDFKNCPLYEAKNTQIQEN